MLIDRLHYALGLDTSGLRSGFGEAGALMSKFDMDMKSLAIGGGIATVTAFLGAVGLKAVGMAKEYGSAMREIWSITDKTSKEIKGIGNEILDISKRIPQTAQQLAKGYYQVLSAGITDSAKAMDVLEVSAKGAIAGMSDTFTTVDAITNVLNAYQLEASKATEISDDMFVAIKDGKLTMEQLAPTIGTVVSTAALAGVAFKEVAAGMVAMTLAGYSPDESATSMNRLFTSIINPTKEARAAAESVGIEWSIAGMKAKGFQGFIADLNKKAGDNVEVLQAIVPEIRAFRAASAIAGTQADAYTRSLDNLRNSAGAAQQAFNKIMDSPFQQWELQKNAFAAEMIKLGNEIMPAVAGSVKILIDLFGALGLEGETEAKRLQREWQFVGKTLASVADTKSRLEALNKVMTLLMDPNTANLQKTFEEVRDFFISFPAQSETAKKMQGFLDELTPGELVKGLQAEIEYLKDISNWAETAGLNLKKISVSSDEVEAKLKQIKELQDQARSLGMVATYEQLGKLAENIRKEQAQAFDLSKSMMLLDNDRNKAAIAIAEAKKAETGELKDGETINLRTGEIKNDELKIVTRILLSEQILLDLEKARKDLAEGSAKEREKELKSMEKMEKHQTKLPRSGGKWMGEETGLTLIPEQPLPKDMNPPIGVNYLDALWANLQDGAKDVRQLERSASDLFYVLSGGDRVFQMFSDSALQMISGLITKNPFDILSGAFGLITSFLTDTDENMHKAAMSTKEFQEAISDYVDSIRDATLAKLAEERADIWWQLNLPFGPVGEQRELLEAKLAEIDKLIANFGQFSDDFAGVVDQWNFTVSTLNIEDPAQKLSIFVDMFKKKFGVELPRATEDALAKIKLFTGYLDQINPATGQAYNILDAFKSAFGMDLPAALTGQDARDLVEQLNNLIRGTIVDSGTKSTKGEEMIAFTKTKQITFRQADEMVLALWSLDQYVRSIYGLLNEYVAQGKFTEAPYRGGNSYEKEINNMVASLNVFATNVTVQATSAQVNIQTGWVKIGGSSAAGPELASAMVGESYNKKLRSSGLVE